MKPDTFFGSLQVLWKIRQLKKLVAKVNVPSDEDLIRLLDLLRETQTRAYLWPVAWPTNWFRALAQSDSVWGQTACTAGKTHDYSQEFIFEMVEYALFQNKLELLEYFQASLSAATLPDGIWERLKHSYPLLQLRFLTSLSDLERIEGPNKDFVLTYLQNSDPFLWMYDHAAWYQNLAVKWNIVAPKAWWASLYGNSLYNPPSPFQYLVKNHQGIQVTRLVETMGKKKYSRAQLELHRYHMLARDPWYLVKSAFFQDHIGWFLQKEHQWSHEVRVASWAVIQAYSLKTIEADVLARITDTIKTSPHDPAMLFILGAPTAPEAYEMFCEWLAMNNEKLTPAVEGEVFSIDNLV